MPRVDGGGKVNGCERARALSAQPGHGSSAIQGRVGLASAPPEMTGSSSVKWAPDYCKIFVVSK